MYTPHNSPWMFSETLAYGTNRLNLFSVNQHFDVFLILSHFSSSEGEIMRQSILAVSLKKTVMISGLPALMAAVVCQR